MRLIYLKNYRLLLFKMIKAAITPGIHPRRVRIKTIRIDPQPLSITARGGKRTDNITLQTLIRIQRYQILRQYGIRLSSQKTIDW